MAEVKLDPRLEALLPVIEEWKALRVYLESLERESDGRPSYGRSIKWIEDAIARIEPQLHSRLWLPVRWRLGMVDFDLVRRNFQHAFSDGYYAQPSVPREQVMERDKIMQWVDRIDKMYQTARQVK
jgi:hypothetical protein